MGVDNVNTSDAGLDGKACGLPLNAHVFASSPCFQGPECGSSPTSGTTDRLVRGDFALACVQSLRSRRLTGWVAGCSLAAAGVCRCVGGGSRTLAGGPSACCLMGSYGSSLPVLSGGPRGGLHLFMGRGRDDDMTAARLIRGLRCEVSTTQKAPCVHRFVQPK